jgi:hypothetical protein
MVRQPITLPKRPILQNAFFNFSALREKKNSVSPKFIPKEFSVSLNLLFDTFQDELVEIRPAFLVIFPFGEVEHVE